MDGFLNFLFHELELPVGTVFLDVSDDSLAPAICAGDLVALDPCAIYAPGVFLLSLDDRLILRRCEGVGPGLVLCRLGSQQLVEDMTLSLDAFVDSCVGRVVGCLHWIDRPAPSIRPALSTS
jgi:hypothetical protein